MKKKSVKSKVVAGLVIVCAVIGGIFTISHIKIIGTGKVGITYTYARGVKDELLKPGAHFIPVSYTHLRAHETPAHLVCSLMHEKKK